MATSKRFKFLGNPFFVHQRHAKIFDNLLWFFFLTPPNFFCDHLLWMLLTKKVKKSTWMKGKKSPHEKFFWFSNSDIPRETKVAHTLLQCLGGWSIKSKILGGSLWGHFVLNSLFSWVRGLKAGRKVSTRLIDLLGVIFYYIA